MFTTYDFYTFVNTAYWGSMLVLILIGWGILKANQARMRFYMAWLVIVSVGFLALILPSPKEYREAKERKERYKQAEAVFKQQCDKASEKIYRTVDNVEGIMLLKVLPEENSFKHSDAHNPMWEDAALQSYAGDGFIRTFLGHHTNGIGYLYIDVLQENQTDVIRYTGRRPLIQEKNPKNPARYAVTFEQNIDPELRKHWVAGGSIKIIDRKTNEIIAEKTSYVFEKGLGGKSGARMPWMFAVDCPNQPFVRPYPIFKFLINVIKPKKEIENV